MDEIQLRAHCLTEARLSFSGRSATAEQIVEAADRLYQFATNAPQKTDVKMPKKRR